MKKLLVTIFLTLFLSGCITPTTPTTNIIPGEKNEQLIQEQQKQIDGLKKQVETLEEKAKMVETESSKAAGSLSAIFEFNTYIEPPLVQEAIREEINLALARLASPDPAEKLRAQERMMLIITNQRDEAYKKYAVALNESNAMKKLIESKDMEIANSKKTIKERDDAIEKLKVDAAKELAKAKADQQAEINRIREEYESKERATWILWVRIASLALVIGGAIMLAVFKMPLEGGGLVLAGTVVGLVSIFVTWLTAQWWFPWLMGLLLVLVLVAVGVGIYRLYKRKLLHEKLTAAMQDLKDESATLGNELWEKVSDHIKYRMGDKNTGLGKEQAKVVKELGLDE